jgi:amidase
MKENINYLTSSFLCILLISLVSCTKSAEYPELNPWKTYDEMALIDSSQQNENQRLRYKRIQSLALDRDKIIETIKVQLEDFTAEKYEELYPLIYDRSIKDLQDFIAQGKLNYKLLTQWYLYRIAITETDKDHSVNAIISINPYAVSKAEYLDSGREDKKHPVFGMPVLLKDNINTKDMPTTAGAMALQHNFTESDAYIVENLKTNGAIILGKVNLSEWANFLCAGCPNGYSGIGGQTLNPYGRGKFDTGGSSSGSAASVAANYAVAAVGTETSGSILSPASQQSLVGLKPTVQKKHQEGIIPISSTLDTPGPISRNVNDNQILYSAMFDIDMPKDDKGFQKNEFRLGAFKSLMADSLYKIAVEKLKKEGFQIIEVEPESMDFNGFLALLNGDMKRDLKSYLIKYTADSIAVKSVADVVKFNSSDSLTNIPYNQARLDGILEQDLNDQELDSIRQKLISSGKRYFDAVMDNNDLDVVLSINNYHAGQAAVAMYPAITVPMGFRETGEPSGLTFIAKSHQENKLFQLASCFENANTID